MDGWARKLEIHRHRHKTRPHRAETGRKVLGAVRREDRNPVAAREPALPERPRDAVRHCVEHRIAQVPRRLLTAEVDDGKLAEVAIAADQIAEILERCHDTDVTLSVEAAAP